MNEKFANVWDWFGDKTSIHFHEDKTKCILFSRDTNLSELNITYDQWQIQRLSGAGILVSAL